MNVYDKRGIPICVGDVLKIYHYTAELRRKKCYMYKWVVGRFVTHSGAEMLMVSHLNEQDLVTMQWYAMPIEDQIDSSVEILQGHSNATDLHFEQRPRKPITTTREASK